MTTLRRSRSALAVVIAALATATATAAATTAAQPRAGARSFMWKATGQQGAVYLVGSVHMLTKDFYPLAPALDAGFKDSDLLVEEVDLSEMLAPDTQFSLLARGMLPAGQTLDEVVSPATMALVNARVGNLGMPASALQQFKPWFLAMTLMAVEWEKAGFDAALGLDKHFYDRAQTQRKAVQGLETTEYQISRFDGLAMNQQEQLQFWTQLLHLDGFQVVHLHQGTPTDPIRLTLLPTVPLGVCPQCHHCCDAIQRRSESRPVRDLPFGPQAIELVIRTYQYWCSDCHHFFTPASPVFAPGAHATERFLEQAARLIRFSDIANAAAFFGVPEKTLERWYYDYVERQRQTPPTALKPIKQIGIDELKLTRGSGQFVAVLVDHTNERVLEVLKNRTKEAVREYLHQNQATGLLAEVVEVTTDMWDGYVEAAREVFGAQVRITIDRFHVMKNFQDHLTAARREIQRSLPKEAAQALKGTRWLWLTNQENLTEGELEESATIRRYRIVQNEGERQREVGLWW
jgi:transposase